MLIEGRHGSRGNFEVVAPASHGGGLFHVWRNNDDGALPWSGPGCFGQGDISGVSLIQGNFGDPGNLEVVAVNGDRLDFYWRQDNAPWNWSGPFEIARAVRGAPALIQSRHGARGNFEVVVPHADSGFVHLWRDNDDPNLPWHGPGRVEGPRLDGVTMIQGNFGSPGNLEVVGVGDGRLFFYWRQDGPPWSWSGPLEIGRLVRGTPSLIQSRHGSRGNFELVAPHAEGGFVHFWRDNDDGALPWHGPTRVQGPLFEAVSLIQGNFGATGNLEVVARDTSGALWFYWRQDSAPWAWSGPFLVGAERRWSVAECSFSWTAAFFQSDTHIIARLQLNPDAGISAQTIGALQTTWRNGIIDKWSNRFDCVAPDGERRRLTVDVQWVTTGAHQVIRVRPGPATSNVTTWDTGDTGDVASHEFGHMLGHPDEYPTAACPARSPVNTGSVMDDNTEAFERHVEHLASFHCGHNAEPPLPFVVAPLPDVRIIVRDFAAASGVDREGFARRLEEIASDPGANGEEAAVRFIVSGGGPVERVEWVFEVHSNGVVRRVSENRLLDEERTEDVTKVSPDRVAALFERVVRERLLEGQIEGREVVPDTVMLVTAVQVGDLVHQLAVPLDDDLATRLATVPAKGELDPGVLDALLDEALRDQGRAQAVPSVVHELVELVNSASSGSVR